MNKITQLTDNAIAVEVPGDASNFDVAEGSLYYNAAYYGFKAIGRMKKIPPGNWQIFGLSTELTKEQCEKIVELHANSNGSGYKYYWKDDGFVPRGFNSIHATALESFNSLLLSKGIVDRNALGEEPKDIPDLGAFTVMMRKRHQEWQQAQQQVKKYLILIKQEGNGSNI